MALDYFGWPLQISHHQAAMETMPEGFSEGRDLRAGYLRGLGLHFGNLTHMCADDPDFKEAFAIARHFTSPVSDHQLCNLFLLLKYYLPHLPPGNLVEFGVHRGGSLLFFANLAAKFLPASLVYGYDSFIGMPTTAPNDVHQRGDFSDRNEDEIMAFVAQEKVKNLRLVKGFFHDSLPLLPKQGPFSLAHIDCDIYSGVKECYLASRNLMIPKGYLVFDDVWIASCIGAYDAVMECVVAGDGRKAEQTWPHLVFRS